MKIALLANANNRYVCADDNVRGQAAPERPLLANRVAIGAWETFDLFMQDATGEWVPFAFPAPPVPVPPVTTWPPAPGTHPPMPPDIDTTNYDAVLERVRWALWNVNSSDDESYWMGVIVVHPEHAPGWTADGYWRVDKINFGDGVGRGYVWPPR